jgi:hypothetical protein
MDAPEAVTGEVQAVRPEALQLLREGAEPKVTVSCFLDQRNFQTSPLAFQALPKRPRAPLRLRQKLAHVADHFRGLLVDHPVGAIGYAAHREICHLLFQAVQIAGQ